MENKDMIWAVLAHLGIHMWSEEGVLRGHDDVMAMASPVFRFDRKLWNEYTLDMSRKGANMIIIDVGEALRFESHPELAIDGSFTREEMEAEIRRLRLLGLEVVPKLNFSAGHDAWLKEYAKMLSSPTYYRVCADLIHEVCDIFKPRFFHLGMDEEKYRFQKCMQVSIVRKDELWWKDFYFLVDCVEKENVRPWIWSDYMWDYPDLFLSKMPKSVVQSNWYYGALFENYHERYNKVMESFDLLDRHGYDQVPTGSNWSHDGNMQGLTKYCTERLNPDKLIGFMQAPWFFVYRGHSGKLFGGNDELLESRTWFEGREGKR